MESIWDDVRFDSAAADAARDALLRAAAQLEQATNVRADEARHAREDWSGAHRDQFDQRLGRALAEAADLIASMRQAAWRIEVATAEAAAEQRRREEMRAELSVIQLPRF